MSLPVVAIVGRVNVGKSSLLNALLGYRRSIVLDDAGTTVDEIIEKAPWAPLKILDFQGILSEQDEALLKRVLSKADAILMVVDAGQGPIPLDEYLATEIKKLRKPALLVINKQDLPTAVPASDFSVLGIEKMVEVSTAHRRNIDEIKQWIINTVVNPLTPSLAPVSPLKVALIGRPNVGKSTLMNRLTLAAISRVSPEPLTTRDPVSFELTTSQGIVQLLDTAGIRRPRTQKKKVELYSVQASTRSIERSDVVLILVSAAEGVLDQDMRLLNLTIRQGKPVAVLINFWDRLTSSERKHFLENCPFRAYLDTFYFLPISALTGFQIDKILPLAFRLNKKSQYRLKTSRLNEIIERIIHKNPPPTAGRHRFNILYASQVRSNPPTFVFFMNRKVALPLSYQSYLQNQLKSALGLKSQAVRVYFRAD